MASQIKPKIAKNVYDTIQNKVNPGNFNNFYGGLNLIRNTANNVAWKILLPTECRSSFDSKAFINGNQELVDKKIVKNVVFNDLGKVPFVEVETDLKAFVKDILDSDPTKFHYKKLSKKVLFEFSSPNIAKRFHVGHLRSTVIGNCLANVHKKFGNDVVKMNYIGDWGTQFGFIQLGMNLQKLTIEDLQRNPLKVLFDAYVKGNSEAELNPELFDEARQIFLKLESEEEEITQMWNKCRQFTTNELSKMYERLGVVFDEYCWESDYRRNKADTILNMLTEKGVLARDDKGRIMAVLDGMQVPLVKSDNTTLYLLRDLMAVAERRSKFKFDEMYYVVDNGQTQHFQTLFALSKELGLDENAKLQHVKFGKVSKMSTRKGKVVFLSDVLDEARDRIYNKQVQSDTTKVILQDKEIADILGVSVLIISDLKQRRLKDYEFSWENNVKLTGNTGVNMQYCLCRLSNLETECGHTAATECDPEALMEPEAVELVSAIAKYEEQLWLCKTSLEPCVLVMYLFELIKRVNSAYKTLNVKNADRHLSRQRLLLFNKSRDVLKEGLELLGLKPLTKM